MEGGEAVSEQRFDPEVTALLREIAKDPRSSLLRIPERPLRPWVGYPEETISPHGSHLTKVEKHLAWAYREEASWILLEACILRLKEDPQIYSTIQPDPERLPIAAGRVVSRVEGGEGPRAALRALAREDEVSTSALAAASLRLAPSEVGLNGLALAHQQEGHVQASLRVLSRFFDGASSSRQRAHAWENRARAHVMRGEFGEAYESEYQASCADASEVRFLVWCLTCALQGGNENKVRETIRRLNAHPGRGLTHIAQRLLEAKIRGLWAPTRASLQLVPHVRGILSEGNRAICELFT
jgi:hypothetical protein